ncbi:tryptophan-rich sensory protein [Fibrobacter sp. UWB2]|uniref:tryptophan-rich sensory protein n=1 Tax=Fibrobacter sp. UWB2 TaxID=1964358 RepID=UPI001E50CB80|nr:tryptophan-rich sensory protein [Fibrobacter sp. UWB2]
MNEILKCLMTFATEILPVILSGIIFFALRKNTSWKKFWLVLGLLLPAFVVFRSVQWLVGKNDLEMAIEDLFFLALYVLGAFIGNFFKTKKVLYVIAGSVVVLLLFLAIKWLVYHDSEMFPFGEIVDEPLQSVELELAQNADYEIEMIQEDAWWNDTRIIAVRERNDSVFYRAAYRMCSAENIDDEGYKHRIKPNIDSVQWALLSPEKSLIAKSLKNSIEKYKQEYHSDLVWDGYSVDVSLKDYKRKTSRRLDLSNASILGMQGAMAIEKMMLDLMPPRETFTTLSYDKVSKKCAEIENARIQQIEASRNSK